MTPLHFLDTNILLYSISKEPRESAKRERAIQLLEDDSGGLSVQVLQEFYVQATRPTRKHILSHELAVGFISVWTRFSIQETTLAVLSGALQIKQDHGYSYWDSAIIAAARELSCKTLYSEDMSHGQMVEGVRIVNPFL